MPPLTKIAHELAFDLLNASFQSQNCYLGGSLSCIDILTALYFGKKDKKPLFKIDIKKPGSDELDYFILSKAHAALALYCVLAKLGYIDQKELASYSKNNSLLTKFPNNKIPGIKIQAGGPGEGLSIANGVAIALKIDKKDNKIFVLAGDGELQEGQMWEAAMTAAHYKLNNLCLIIDCNKMQQDGHIKGIKNIEPIYDKFKAFGWQVLSCTDGHNIKELIDLIPKAWNKNNTMKPTCIITPTIKGYRIPFMENKSSYHNSTLSKPEMDLALKQLNTPQNNTPINV